MNRQKNMDVSAAPAPSRFSRTPHIVQSALFGILFSAAISLIVIATLYALSDNPERLAEAYRLLLFNLLIVSVLTIYLGYRVWAILYSKKSRRSAPLLHRRFVLVFSLAALVPAILVGAFSSSLITRNINDVIGDNVGEVLDTSLNFLNRYVADEIREIGIQLIDTHRFLEANEPIFEDRISYTYNLNRFSRSVDLDAIYVINKEGVVLARVISQNSPEFKIPNKTVFEYLEQKGVNGFQSRDDIDYLIGLTKMNGYDGLYLMVGRYLRSNVGVLSSLRGIQDTKNSLSRQHDQQDNMRRTFLLALIEFALLILLGAVWFGVVLANNVIEPLGRIIYAAEQVRAGDLTARVSVKREWGEMTDLGSAFNRMTRQLGSQRDDIIRERDVSEQRRQFSEAVLSGVTAGVIGLSQDGRVTLMNASAERLTGHESSHVLGHPIDFAFPEFSEAFQRAREDVSKLSEHQVNLETENGVRNFDLRVSAYHGAREDMGWVLTFDDMTRLVTAQRHSAWREVARRIAHEIKNPLTPIQLSAERLKRKYKSHKLPDRQIFENCTDTIIRQVGSLEQMVDEFSSFARMPAPEFVLTKAQTMLENILFAQGVAFPDVTFEFVVDDTESVSVNCDERLISQALTNVYKNAAEAIAAWQDRDGGGDIAALIETRLFKRGEYLVIGIGDNGKGWPVPDRERLLEPYVTTRDHGTGLGLAIVARIAEDHHGRLTLGERPDKRRGAYLEITLPLAVLADTLKITPTKDEAELI